MIRRSIIPSEAMSKPDYIRKEKITTIRLNPDINEDEREAIPGLYTHPLTRTGSFASRHDDLTFFIANNGSAHTRCPQTRIIGVRKERKPLYSQTYWFERETYRTIVSKRRRSNSELRETTGTNPHRPPKVVGSWGTFWGLPR